MSHCYFCNLPIKWWPSWIWPLNILHTVFFCLYINPWVNKPTFGHQNHYSRSISTCFIAIFCNFQIKWWPSWIWPSNILYTGFFVVLILMLILELINITFGHQNHHSRSINTYFIAIFLLFFFFYKMATILDLAIKYLTYCQDVNLWVQTSKPNL